MASVFIMRRLVNKISVLSSASSSLAQFRFSSHPRFVVLSWPVCVVLSTQQDAAWSLPVSCYLVIIMGVQSYEGKEHRYVDYPVMDVLQMMGRACRPLEDERSRCVLMTQQTRKDFYKRFLSDGLPIESHLPTHLLHDYFLAEVAVKTIENKQEAMVILLCLPLFCLLLSLCLRT